MSGFWESILKAETKIGMNDNFFELGGHSLLAMRLAMALRCDVRTIMVNPTVSSLLEHLSDNVDAIDKARATHMFRASFRSKQQQLQHAVPCAVS